MWTGNQVTQWSIALAVLMLVACSPKEEPAKNQAAPLAAWWYNIQFRPTSTTIHGLDVRTIDADWKRATTLDVSLLNGRISDDEIQMFNKSTLSFSLISDLDGDGISEDFFVGVYETNEGEIGRFIAITRKGQVLQHFKESGTGGFSGLLQADRTVRWYKCMECGEFESIKWSGESFILE